MYIYIYTYIYIYIYIHISIRIYIYIYETLLERSAMYSTAATSKDRAVQIIALPAVFGCTAMNAATPSAVFGFLGLGVQGRI